MRAHEDSRGRGIVTGGMKGNAQWEIQANSTTKSEWQGMEGWKLAEKHMDVKQSLQGSPSENQANFTGDGSKQHIINITTYICGFGK